MVSKRGPEGTVMGPGGGGRSDLVGGEGAGVGDKRSGPGVPRHGGAGRHQARIKPTHAVAISRGLTPCGHDTHVAGFGPMELCCGALLTSRLASWEVVTGGSASSSRAGDYVCGDCWMGTSATGAVDGGKLRGERLAMGESATR
eukprot:1188812-Prorocentrum_minimum.AAC.3